MRKLLLNFWEKNKKILLGCYSGLFKEISVLDDDLSSVDIKTETTPAGVPTLYVKGIYVHSQHNPLREGQRLADSVSGEKGAIVILGFGLGYTALAAAKSGRPVIIVEKYKQILRKAFELCDLSDFLSKNRLLFIVGGTGEGITSALEMASDKNDGKKISVIRNKALTGLDEQWYSSVQDRIRVWTMKDEVNKATHKRFGQRWVRNFLRNIDAVRDYPGISHLAGMAGGNEEGGKEEGGRRKLEGGSWKEQSESWVVFCRFFWLLLGPVLTRLGRCYVIFMTDVLSLL